MAYENQDKCADCSISIPPVHEDADPSARLCDKCDADAPCKCGGLGVGVCVSCGNCACEKPAEKLYNVHLYPAVRKMTRPL